MSIVEQKLIQRIERVRVTTNVTDYRNWLIENGYWSSESSPLEDLNFGGSCRAIPIDPKRNWNEIKTVAIVDPDTGITTWNPEEL